MLCQSVPSTSPSAPTLQGSGSGQRLARGAQSAPRGAGPIPACLSHPCNCLVQLGVGRELIALLHH